MFLHEGSSYYYEKVVALNSTELQVVHQITCFYSLSGIFNKQKCVDLLIILVVISFDVFNINNKKTIRFLRI